MPCLVGDQRARSAPSFTAPARRATLGAGREPARSLAPGRGEERRREMPEKTDDTAELQSPSQEARRSNNRLTNGQVYRAGVALQAFYREEDGHCVPTTHLDDEQIVSQVHQIVGFPFTLHNLEGLREQIFGPMRVLEDSSPEARIARLDEQVASLTRDVGKLRQDLIKEQARRVALIETIQRVQPDIRERLSERFRVTSR